LFHLLGDLLHDGERLAQPLELSVHGVGEHRALVEPVGQRGDRDRKQRRKPE
jgi:hypothetical protein